MGLHRIMHEKMPKKSVPIQLSFRKLIAMCSRIKQTAIIFVFTKTCLWSSGAQDYRGVFTISAAYEKALWACGHYSKMHDIIR